MSDIAAMLEFLRADVATRVPDIEWEPPATEEHIDRFRLVFEECEIPDDLIELYRQQCVPIGDSGSRGLARLIDLNQLQSEPGVNFYLDAVPGAPCPYQFQARIGWGPVGPVTVLLNGPGVGQVWAFRPGYGWNYSVRPIANSITHLLEQLVALRTPQNGIMPPYWNEIDYPKNASMFPGVDRELLDYLLGDLDLQRSYGIEEVFVFDEMDEAAVIAGEAERERRVDVANQWRKEWFERHHPSK